MVCIPFFLNESKRFIKRELQFFRRKRSLLGLGPKGVGGPGLVSLVAVWILVVFEKCIMVGASTQCEWPCMQCSVHHVLARALCRSENSYV